MTQKEREKTLDARPKVKIEDLPENSFLRRIADAHHRHGARYGCFYKGKHIEIVK